MKLVGLIGSNAEYSYNRMLLEFIAKEYTDLFELDLIEIKNIPMFNQSHDQTESAVIQNLSDKIVAADGIIIATPEHNRTIPPALKSVIEWLSYKIHPMDNKPVLVVGASYYDQGTSRAQLHLRQILEAPGVGAYVFPGNEFLLGKAKEAFDNNKKLKDEDTVQFLRATLEKFTSFARIIVEFDQSEKAALENITFTPGEYTVTAPGYNGDLPMIVTFSADKIESIKVDSSGESEGITDPVFTRIPEEIVDGQSLNVDAISGATYTSQGVIDGVAEAVELAGADPDLLKKRPKAKKQSAATKIEKSTDVVIIGAGGAGLSAALEINAAGKEAIIVEKMPTVGGNTLRATGGLNAAETSVQATLNIEDNVKTHYDDTMKGGHYKNDPVLVETLTGNVTETVEWLIDLGADLSDVGRMGGATNSRSHRPAGGAPVGPHLVKVLKSNVEEKGIEILLETEVTEILYEDHKTQGIVAKDVNGNQVTIHAKAIIITAGGFGANEDMIIGLNESLEGFSTTNHPGATGDGITLATNIGAATTQMEEIQTHPTLAYGKTSMITEAVRGNGAILINREGKRFTDEIGTRDKVSEDILDQTGRTAFLFFDDSVRDSLSAIEGYVNQGLTIEGDSIKEIANKLEIDSNNLEETIESYNSYVEAGKDDAFARADMPTKLDQGKYYAIEVVPAVHHTMGGLEIDSQAHVLTEDKDIIPGLYAAGEVTGGVHGGNRLGGNALADIFTYGRIAGKTAVQEI